MKLTEVDKKFYLKAGVREQKKMLIEAFGLEKSCYQWSKEYNLDWKLIFQAAMNDQIETILNKKKEIKPLVKFVQGKPARPIGTDVGSTIGSTRNQIVSALMTTFGDNIDLFTYALQMEINKDPLNVYKKYMEPLLKVYVSSAQQEKATGKAEVNINFTGTPYANVEFKE